MNILSRITKNLFQKAHTRRPEAAVPHPEGFRGALLHEPSLCTACGTCAYVCSPSAIVVDRSLPEHASWQYRLLGCTFCGRCVEFCPTQALSFDPQLALPLTQVRPSAHLIAYTPCARCGEGILPLPQKMLEKTYGSPIPPEIDQMNRLCDRCRGKVHSSAIKRGFTGSSPVGE